MSMSKAFQIYPPRLYSSVDAGISVQCIISEGIYKNNVTLEIKFFLPDKIINDITF